MKRLAILFGCSLLAVQLAGCGSDGAGPPPTTDPRATWPDEVKQAEEKFEKDAAAKAAKYNKPPR